jgi:hypothetical protein
MDSERHPHSPPDSSIELRHHPPACRPHFGLSRNSSRYPHLLRRGWPLVPTRFTPA